jgi:arsenate reductase
MRFTIYHNPDCGTSRNVLAALRSSGVEPEIIEYLKHPPDRSTLLHLIDGIGLPVRGVVRERGTPFHELGLDDPTRSDDELVDAMMKHPILINRPIVVAPTAVQLCRPSDVVLGLVNGQAPADLKKEDGAKFLRDAPISGQDRELRSALAEAQLPVDDLEETGRHFFAYRTLDGTLAGFGGYELYGSDVLLRSIVVPPKARSARIGRTLVPLLTRRAFDHGARRAFVLTTTAKSFFERLGFARIDRDTAPPDILATRQAAGLCPSSAPLLARRIAL